MKKINFLKMHGLGNDFVILDSYSNPDLYSSGHCNLATQEIQLICHRNFGIGCDQLLLIEPSTNKSADFDYRIYNQDGSSASHCGNGARCLTSYLLSKNDSIQQVTLNIAGNLVYGRKTDNNMIMINMEIPSFKPEDVGYLGGPNAENHYSYANKTEVTTKNIDFAICSVGNPHAMIKLDNVSKLEDDAMLATTALALQNSGQFEHGVNVNFFVIDNGNINLRTFERGCGFTLACGTGACATASYCIWEGQVQSPVKVNMPGGSVEIHWDKDSKLQMVGSATHVFSGEMTL